MGGEIDALDPGGFGAVTITKSITIDGSAGLASVLVAGTNGIVVNGTGIVVVLRRLSITAVGTPGLTGINFMGGGALHVEDCVISGFSTSAISAVPADTGAKLYVKGTTIRANAGTGIHVGQSVLATIEKSQVNGSSVGLDVADSAKVSVHDSVFAGNVTGVLAAGASQINIEHGLVANNNVGVQANATVRLSEVMVSNNTSTGVAGSVVSFGNNRIAAGNGADGSPASTVPQQ